MSLLHTVDQSIHFKVKLWALNLEHFTQLIVCVWHLDGSCVEQPCQSLDQNPSKLLHECHLGMSRVQALILWAQANEFMRKLLLAWILFSTISPLVFHLEHFHFTIAQTIESEWAPLKLSIVWVVHESLLKPSTKFQKIARKYNNLNKINFIWITIFYKWDYLQFHIKITRPLWPKINIARIT